ncbi:hypothetical protein KL938_003264 [Ogataea parapolymorpha]|nr:hypothetical protein KL938_003264 [Ogataea parapolymorpha]
MLHKRVQACIEATGEPEQLERPLNLKNTGGTKLQTRVSPKTISSAELWLELVNGLSDEALHEIKSMLLIMDEIQQYTGGISPRRFRTHKCVDTEEPVARYGERFQLGHAVGALEMEMQQVAQDRIVKIGAQVSFAAAVASGSWYTCEDGPVLQMLAQLSTFRHLHSEVYENGEAYGGGVTYEAQNGIFT